MSNLLREVFRCMSNNNQRIELTFSMVRKNPRQQTSYHFDMKANLKKKCML